MVQNYISYLSQRPGEKSGKVDRQSKKGGVQHVRNRLGRAGGPQTKEYETKQ